MRQDLRLQCLPRRMFQEGVTRLELPRLGYLADTEDNRSTIGAHLELSSLRSEQVQQSRWTFVLRLHARFRKNDVGAEKLRHIVFHYFACALRLSTVKRKAELIQPLAGQITSARSRPLLKRSKERTGDPPAAIVRSEFVIFDDDHP